MNTVWLAAFWVMVVTVGGCGDDAADSVTTRQSAVAGSVPADEPETVTANGETFYPASAAGTPSESGPGLPFDFAGVVTESLSLTQEERDSITRANVQAAARKAETSQATPAEQGAQ